MGINNKQSVSNKQTTNRIKLLYATEAAGGGTLKHLVYLTSRLNQNEFDITVILPNEEYEKDTKSAVAVMRQKGIRVDTIPMAKQISLVRDLSALMKIRSYLKKHHFDIIHAHSSKAGALFRIAAICVRFPVVIYTPHCCYFTAHTGAKRHLYARIERILARITDCIVISGVEQTAWQKERIAAAGKTVTIDNAVDPKEYERLPRQQAKRLLNIPENRYVVVGVGRPVKQKNWETFVKTAETVLRRNNKITFVIAGDGPDLKRLKTMTNHMGISSDIRFYGHADNVSLVYSAADVFVSTSRYEGLPYTYLEALLYDIPMLIMHTEGMGYFFRLTNAVSVPQNDILFLSEEILKTPTNPPEVKNSSTSPFSLAQFIDQHEKLYRQLHNHSMDNG